MEHINHPVRIVDLHTHLFNARCLPMAGIIANVMGKDASDSGFARALARVVDGLCDDEGSEKILPSPLKSTGDLSNEESIELIVSKVSNRLGLYGFNPRFDVQSLAPDVRTSLASNWKETALAEPLAGFISDLEAELLELQKSGAIHSLELDLLDTSESLTSLVTAGVAEKASERVSKVIRLAFRFIQKFIDATDEIQNFASFCFSMLHSVKTQTDTLIARYGDCGCPLEMVHHMMDMEYAYYVNQTKQKQVHPTYDFITDQLDIFRGVGHSHPEKLRGFVAFDPRRLDPKSADWPKVVSSLYGDESGFYGFKFYPAMGYLPTGQPDSAPCTYQITQSEIALRVEAFFLWCVKEDVPVFTHCTPIGFETRFKEGLNTSPSIWAQLLAKPEFSQLRLCFGHAGGGHAIRGKKNERVTYHGWTAATSDQWNSPLNFANTVAALCRKYPNVYCELAYITELFEHDTESQLEASTALQRNIQLASQPQPHDKFDFMRKVAYGSDWNMPSMVRHPKEYLNVFLEIFRTNADLNPHTDYFFSKNAHAFLGKQA